MDKILKIIQDASKSGKSWSKYISEYNDDLILSDSDILDIKKTMKDNCDVIDEINDNNNLNLSNQDITDIEESLSNLY